MNVCNKKECDKGLEPRKQIKKSILNLIFQKEYLFYDVLQELEKSGAYEISLKSTFSGKWVFDYLMFSFQFDQPSVQDKVVT